MPNVLELTTPPPMPGQYARALVKGGKPGAPVPELEATVARVTLDPAAIAAYAKVCGFARTDRVPVTYPQVLAAPVQMALMLDDAFPFKLLGLVHVKGTIEQNRPLVAGESLSLRVKTGEVRDVRLGREFDLHTTFEAQGVRWTSVTTALAREKTPEKGPKREKEPAVPGEPPNAIRSMQWKLGADLGRRYAAVSGDYNPIHMYGVTAKAFGFPRAIIHGMWNVAHAVAELDSEIPGAAKLSFEFKKPVLLPSKVLFTAHREGAGIDFAIRSKDASQVHVTGRVE